MRRILFGCWLLAFSGGSHVVSSASDVGDFGHRLDGKTVEETFRDPDVVRLARAACVGDDQAVGEIVRSGVPVDARGEENLTPLIWAISCRNVAGVKALLRAGANPNHVVADDTPLLLISAGWDDPWVLRLLLEHGADPNSAHAKTGETALMRAATLGVWNQQWDGYELLLKVSDIDQVNALDDTVGVQLAGSYAWHRVGELMERGVKRGIIRIALLASAADPADFEFSSPEEKRIRVEGHRRVLAHLEARGIEMPLLGGAGLISRPDLLKRPDW